ncbi:MAG: molybdopterin synthase catalytic subunit MoaE [Pseudomonadales bacterium]
MLTDIYVAVQKEDFDVSAELCLMRQQSRQVGAMASFVGVVRDINDNQQVATMELEHYPGMTEKSIRQIVKEASQRWSLLGARVIHRIGKLAPTDQIVLVAVSSLHRGESFAACEFIMDYLKTQAPFWKKELTAEGERWVDARCTDQSAAQRWSE